MAKDNRRGLPRELYFEDDNQRGGRTGEQLHDNDATELTGERARTAGQSGGEALDGDSVDNRPTADDLSPETLLREQGGELGEGEAADHDLREVEEDRAGLGHGLDEAELADVDPVGKSKAGRAGPSRKR